MKQIFGIDLGTTNSCISWLNQGRPEVIAIDGSPVVPSVVSFDTGEAIVGQRAKNRALLHPEQTVSSIKRKMGTDDTVTAGGRTMSPEDVSAFILGYLKREAEKACAASVQDVVITVPAYFSDAQRRATKQAGELAGLRVERIINEPTAAAMFYNHLNNADIQAQERHVLVYDLGGGTFDVSILRMGELNEVLSSTGNTLLGGDDFDHKLIELCLDHVKTGFHADLSEYRPALARLKSSAEKAKIALSNRPFAVIDEPLLPNPEKKSIDLQLEISREGFEDLIANLVNSTADEVDQALAEARVPAEAVDQVLLVGGSTQIPLVIRLMEERFGASRLPVVDPDLSVAKGAAIQAGIISGSHVHQVLIDVTSHTLSTEALVSPYSMTVKCVPIIPRNTQIPVTRAEVFSTLVDNQSRVDVHVYQGESEDPEENTLIGSLDLALAPAPANSPVLLEYSYDLNGIIHVKVEHKGYSRKREVDLDAFKQNQHFLEIDLDSQDELDWETGNDDSEETEAETRQVTNYILQKARNTVQHLDDQAQHSELESLIAAYEKALQGADEDLVDETEERLVDFLDDLEERDD
jgi:molecular chaperone DnaK